jgi:hypothetical protein
MSLRQKVTYWSKGVRDGYGNLSYPSPRVVLARWEDKQVLFIDSSGEQTLSRSVIYSDEIFDEEGYLLLGISTSTTPIELEKAFKIKGISIIPNLSNTKREIKSWL